MKIRSNKQQILCVLWAAMLFVLASCEDLVEDGYTIDYEKSDAELIVEAIGDTIAAQGETISFRIEVNSASNIKSCIIQSTKPGLSGSGFDVATEGFDDPFADHVYGTISKNINSFVVKYDYVVPEDATTAKITFSIIDEQGKVTQTREIKEVTGIKKYFDKKLYAKNNFYNDAFATIDGVVYPDISTNFSTTSVENVTVQEKIDIIFYVNNGSSFIAAPAYGGVGLDLSVENNTKFKQLTNINNDDFENMTAGLLVQLTQADSINYYGAPAISGVKVGDIIGFSTDLNAIHSLKTGLIRINQLHPTSIQRYEGISYVMECDIITQTEE